MATPRKNLGEVIESMTAAEKSAIQAKLDALAAMPVPEMTIDIPWDMAYSDREFNVRDDSSYSKENNLALYASLRDRGLEMRAGDNMAFSLQENGRYKVIAGHLRHTVMGYVRADILAENATLPADKQKAVPFNTIFGMVFAGLSYDQETALMADHIMKKDLNEFERVKEIGAFLEASGLTDAKGSIKFGLNRNMITRARYMYNMPTVLGEYRKEKAKDGRPYVKVSQLALTNLWSAYLADREAGALPRQEGPNFRRVWDQVAADPATFNAGKKEEKILGKDRETLLSQAKSLGTTFGNTPEVKATEQVIRWAAGDATATLLGGMEDLQTYVRQLTLENEVYKNDANELRSTLAERDATIVGLQAEIDRLSALKTRK